MLIFNFVKLDIQSYIIPWFRKREGLHSFEMEI